MLVAAHTPLLARRAVKIVLWVIALAAPAVYIYYLLQYAINVPYWDDYDVILGNLNWHEQELPLSQHLSYIFLEHGNEHLTATLQLFALGERALLGHADFRIMVLAGNVFLFVFAFFALRQSRSEEMKLVWLLPAVPLLFNFHYHEATYWGTVAMQLFPAALFSWLSIYYLLRAGWKGLLLSMLFSILTLITFGSGVVLLLLATILLALYRRWMHLSVHIVFLGVMIYMFFLFYPDMPHADSKLDAIFVRPLATLHFFFALCGTGIELPRGIVWVPGLMVTIWFAWLTLRRYWKQNPVVYFFMLFIFLVVAAGAVSRSGKGIGEAFASRYSFNSAMLLFFTWVSIADRLRSSLRPYVAVGGLVAAMGLWGMHLSPDLDTIRQVHKEKMQSIIGYHPDKESVLYRPPEIALLKMNAAISNGLYLPPRLSDPLMSKPELNMTPPVQFSPFPVTIRSFYVGCYAVKITGRLQTIINEGNIFVWLESRGKTFRFPVHLNDSEEQPLPHIINSFELLIDKKQLPAGLYKLGVECRRSSGPALFSWKEGVFPVYNPCLNIVQNSLMQDSIGGRLSITGEVEIGVEDPNLSLLFSGEAGNWALPAKILNSRRMEAESLVLLSNGGKRMIWQTYPARKAGPPHNNFTLDFRLLVNSTCVMDSMAEATLPIESPGRKVCVQSFPTDTNNWSIAISAGANGIALSLWRNEESRLLGWAKGIQTGWNHVCLVVSNNQPVLYLNGETVINVKAPVENSLMLDPNYGHINDNGFAGAMDDISIRDYVLDADAVKLLAAGKTPAGKDPTYHMDFSTLTPGSSSIPATDGIMDWEMNTPYLNKGLMLEAWPDVFEAPPGEYEVSLLLMDKIGGIVYLRETGMKVKL